MNTKVRKIVTINWSIHDGSIAKIINDIEQCAGDHYKFIHCYQLGEKGNKNNLYLISGKKMTLMYYFLARIVGIKYGLGLFPTKKLLRFIKQTNPDVIHIHCPNYYSVNLYQLLNFLKVNNIPTIITNHAEFFYTGNCAYAQDCIGYLHGCTNCNRVFDTRHKYLLNRTSYEWKKMKEAFENFDNVQMIAVSKWTYDRMKTAPITSNLRIHLIENGIDTINIFHHRDSIELRGQYKDNINQKIILHVTANFSIEEDDIKGGRYIIKLAQNLPDYKFIVAGNINLSDMSIIPSNMVCIGNITDQIKLSEYYSIADLTVLTSKRETFGMACAESLSCGTPVVGFLSGGTETIAIPQYTEFVEYGNLSRLEDCIESWIDKKNIFAEEIEREASVKYSKERMSNQYIEIYENAIKLKNSKSL